MKITANLGTRGGYFRFISKSISFMMNAANAIIITIASYTDIGLTPFHGSLANRLPFGDTRFVV